MHYPMLFLGMEHAAMKDYKLAQEYFVLALEVNPNDPLLLHEIGSVYYAQQRYQLAIEHFVKVLELVKNTSSRVWLRTKCNLGHAYRKDGNLVAAKKVFSDIKDELEVKGSASSGLALISYAQGLLEESLIHLHNWQKVDPDNSICETLLEMVLLELAKEQITAPLPVLDDSWLDQDLLQAQLDEKIGNIRNEEFYMPQIEGHEQMKSFESKATKPSIFGNKIKGRSSIANDLSPDVFNNPSKPRQVPLKFESSSPPNIDRTPPRSRRRLFDRVSEIEKDEFSTSGIQFSLNDDYPFEDDIFDDPNRNSMEVDGQDSD